LKKRECIDFAAIKGIGIPQKIHQSLSLILAMKGFEKKKKHGDRLLVYSFFFFSPQEDNQLTRTSLFAVIFI